MCDIFGQVRNGTQTRDRQSERAWERERDRKKEIQKKRETVSEKGEKKAISIWFEFSGHRID